MSELLAPDRKTLVPEMGILLDSLGACIDVRGRAAFTCLDLLTADGCVAEYERMIAERDGLIRELFRLVHYGPCRAGCDHFDKDTCGIDLNDGVCWYEVKLGEMGVEL